MAYLLKRKLTGDGALFNLQSHWDIRFFSGRRLPSNIPLPIELEIDLDSDGRTMPTMFLTPAFVATNHFLHTLQAAGVDNMQQYAAIIRNPATGEIWENYSAVNPVGLVACADLAANPGFELGPGVRVLDEPIIQKNAAHDLAMFRLAEDPIQIIISDRIASAIQTAGFDDIYLEQLVSK